ncbi:FAD-dependent pyridine nucleotide-disulfideoxidoreductase [Thiohalobacter thiocyanaticus]|uniref:Sulfide-quinone reductase n=1 Tax=Thiohalobacter thiocyanaticus TaxID=585455 RepID=A0A1Z4VRB0_9GAMM|nr:FAD/NAD(P)-binding oxidoreductase [Thiohalobacter thiocyanaticus]BAZ94180.1 FAD-dependent pyridine nucleotide-disulfideoxidoreductase [Thiohalobacter thiocyanaticus]
MAHIVIIGASTGGMPAAYEIKEALGSDHRVTVINATPDFHFVPSNPWVAVGWRSRADISFDIKPRLENKGIDFIPVAVSEIKPDDNKLVLTDGQAIDYDYLVIATGPKLAFDEIEGLGPDGFTESVCTVGHAEKAYGGWQKFVHEPGPIVVGAVQGASCFGPAYEFAFIMDADLRNRKLRDKVPMTFVTSEPYIGHLGLGGVGDSKGMMESELRQRHINWITNAKVDRIEAGKMYVSEHNDDGEVIKQHELPFNYSMMLPAFKGVDAVAALGEELVNPRGFVKVDEYQRNPKWHNIYSVGVCIAIPPVEATPVPTGTPKTGYMIESMVTAVAHNIKNDLESKPVDREATWNAICLADMGDTGVAFVAMPQIPPRNVSWMKKGKWVHYAKVAFEKYFLSKMKRGSTEPVYEKYVLKAIGIAKLK